MPVLSGASLLICLSQIHAPAIPSLACRCPFVSLRVKIGCWLAGCLSSQSMCHTVRGGETAESSTFGAPAERQMGLARVFGQLESSKHTRVTWKTGYMAYSGILNMTAATDCWESFAKSSQEDDTEQSASKTMFHLPC